MAKLRTRTRRLTVDGVDLSPFIRARLRHSTWFKAPALQAVRGRSLRPFAHRPGLSYADAKALAYKAADLHLESAVDMVDRELHRPGSSLNHGTVRVCGKPYHWRQDYTGQLKLAAGESPW